MPNAFASSVVRHQGRLLMTLASLQEKQDTVCATSGSRPSFVEVYGRGGLIHEAQGRRRDLNIEGLQALDIRTSKPDGTPWDFTKPADRKKAYDMIIELEPTWVIGAPPMHSIQQIEC